MNIWFEETHTDGYRVHWRIKETLWYEKTPFQELRVVDMVDFGRALSLMMPCRLRAGMSSSTTR